MPPFHEFKVLDELAGKFRGKHGTALQGFFQGGFEFLAGLVLPGVYEYSAGNFTPCDGIGFPHGGQGYGIGGMLRFPAMGANIPGISLGLGNPNVFHGMYGVHRRLLTLNYIPLWRERQLFPVLWGFPGAPPLGYLPDSLKGRFRVNRLPCAGFYPQSMNSLVNRIFGDSKFFSQFLYCESFHKIIIRKKREKINRIFYKVIDKPNIMFYDVYIESHSKEGQSEEAYMDYQKRLKMTGYRLVCYKRVESDLLKGYFIFALYTRKGKNPQKWYKQKFLEQGGECSELWRQFEVYGPEEAAKYLGAAKRDPNAVFVNENAAGSTADFDHVFTPGMVKESPSKEYLERLTSTQVS
jgi:hypothetical protein